MAAMMAKAKGTIMPNTTNMRELPYWPKRFLRGFRSALRQHVKRHLFAIAKDGDEITMEVMQKAISRGFGDYTADCKMEPDYIMIGRGLEAINSRKTRSAREFLNDLRSRST